jgi:hypothetical protein
MATTLPITTETSCRSLYPEVTSQTFGDPVSPGADGSTVFERLKDDGRSKLFIDISRENMKVYRTGQRKMENHPRASASPLVPFQTSEAVRDTDRG